ncbi:MAG: hypothetical protein LBP59_08050 [Planctomycetaceae bacterium]|jgi:hypothetical protein|nr:hypothetical protein [Planctomycetaceae bacterium]
MISKVVFRFIGLFCVCFIISALGCAGVDAFRKPDLKALLPPGPVDKAIALWGPAVQTGDQPQRGFGGRVYFYDSEARTPIKVDGMIAVYAFDETDRNPNDNEPTRIYTFAKDDVKKSYAKAKWGHSYNLWVPWDTEGPEGESKKISFIVRYIPDKGNSIISQQATAYLSGKETKNEMIAKNNQQNNQQNNSTVIQQTTFNATEKFTDAMRQPQQEILTKEPEKLPAATINQTEHIIEKNINRPQKMKTITIRG